jgi:hypothetical protein
MKFEFHCKYREAKKPNHEKNTGENEKIHLEIHSHHLIKVSAAFKSNFVQNRKFEMRL